MPGPKLWHRICSLYVWKQYEKTDSDSILLIHAENAFNSLNWNLALKNIAKLCRFILPAIQNSYSNSSNPSSREGTTQGDPLAMAMYGLATLPLIKLVNGNSLTQKWYADDGNAVGNLSSWQHYQTRKIFWISCKGIEKPDQCKKWIMQKSIQKYRNWNEEKGQSFWFCNKIRDWCKIFLNTQLEEHNKILKKLGKIAKTSPQNVYSCCTKGVQEKFSFLVITTPIPQKTGRPARKYCREISFQI